uniref:Uncharacterized protein n=1 Tax=Solanum tuberosum TaxID=4113 RepID=M1DH97_SOLTU
MGGRCVVNWEFGTLLSTHWFRASRQGEIIPAGRGRCGRMRAAIAGQSRLKSEINPKNAIILKTSFLRVRRRTRATSYSFSPFLKLKTKNKRKESRKGRMKYFRRVQALFEVGDVCDFLLV